MPDSDATTLPQAREAHYAAKEAVRDHCIKHGLQQSDLSVAKICEIASAAALATVQSQDELCTFTLPDGGPCNLSGSHNVHTLLGGSLQHLFRPATSQAKGHERCSCSHHRTRHVPQPAGGAHPCLDCVFCKGFDLDPAL